MQPIMPDEKADSAPTSEATKFVDFAPYVKPDHARGAARTF
jgi:hypothetical protein